VRPEEAEKNPRKGSGKLAIKGNHLYKEGGKGGIFHPLTVDTCIQCGLCVKNCPTGAIDSDCSTIDSGRCISCFRCIRRCPVQAKNMNDSSYMAFAEDFSKKLATRRENEYFLPQK
jgi:ferredoxin